MCVKIVHFKLYLTTYFVLRKINRQMKQHFRGGISMRKTSHYCLISVVAARARLFPGSHHRRHQLHHDQPGDL